MNMTEGSASKREGTISGHPQTKDQLGMLAFAG